MAVILTTENQCADAALTRNALTMISSVDYPGTADAASATGAALHQFRQHDAGL